MCALCIAFCRESLKTDQHRSSLMAFARLLSRTSAKGPLLWPAAHLFVRQHKPVGSIACTHHQQPMSDGVPVSHPVATAKDQLAWEQVLQQHESQHPANSGVPATAHPAVGASQAECEEWEAALSTSTNAAPLQVAPCSAEQGVYAVVECGSHTTRLLLSTGTADIARINHDTHLAAVLSAAASPASGQHPQLPAGSEATLAAVREYKQRIDVHQGDLRGVRAIATAAVRDAPEGPAIAAAVHAILQRPVEVLSGEVLLSDGCRVLLQHTVVVLGCRAAAGMLGTMRRLVAVVACHDCGSDPHGFQFCCTPDAAGLYHSCRYAALCRPSAMISQWGCGRACKLQHVFAASSSYLKVRLLLLLPAAYR